MSATSKSTKKPRAIEITDSGTREAQVLYQKLGDKWYAFSLVDDEVFVGSIEGEQAQDLDLVPQMQDLRAKRPIGREA